MRYLTLIGKLTQHHTISCNFSSHYTAKRPPIRHQGSKYETVLVDGLPHNTEKNFSDRGDFAIYVRRPVLILVIRPAYMQNKLHAV